MHKCKRKHTKSRLFIILTVLSHKPFPPHTQTPTRLHPPPFQVLTPHSPAPTPTPTHKPTRPNCLNHLPAREARWPSSPPANQTAWLTLEITSQLIQPPSSALLEIFGRDLNIASWALWIWTERERRLDVWCNLRCDYVELTGKR